MTGYVLKTLALNEVRLRMRRLSTIVALLAVVAISWAMIADPAGGDALIVVDKARVLYTSSALALGSSTLASMLFGLGGFYLVRGRIAEDMRSGAGSVIGATPVGNALFLAGRWLGAVAYLGLLLLAFMGTIMVCHALRGDGPIEPLVYLSTYCLILLPMIFFAASCAILFDSWAPLMGKARRPAVLLIVGRADFDGGDGAIERPCRLAAGRCSTSPACRRPSSRWRRISTPPTCRSAAARSMRRWRR